MSRDPNRPVYQCAGRGCSTHDLLEVFLRPEFFHAGVPRLSDLHLRIGQVVRTRLDGDLVPLRDAEVLTRESFAALLVFALGAAALWQPRPYLPLAAAAALAFVFCQGRILRASKGIPAWRAPQVTLLIVSTGLAEGAGIALFFTTAPLLVAWFGLAVILRAFAWSRYASAVRSPALVAPAKVLVQIGTVGVLLLAILAFWMPDLALLAGAAALVTGQWLKFALVTRASLNQGFHLPHLPVRGTR